MLGYHSKAAICKSGPSHVIALTTMGSDRLPNAYSSKLPRMLRVYVHMPMAMFVRIKQGRMGYAKKASRMLVLVMVGRDLRYMPWCGGMAYKVPR